MQANFYAINDDLLQLTQWFLDVPGMSLFESSSGVDQPVKQFRSVAELEQTFQKPSTGWRISAWLEATRARPIPRHVTFNRETQHRVGGIGRTELISPSLIHITRNNDQNGSLSVSHISCWNEAGAKQHSWFTDEFLDQVDWKALRSITGKLQRKIDKASPAKFQKSPIMEHAFDDLRDGRRSIWGWGAACSYPSPEFTLA